MAYYPHNKSFNCGAWRVQCERLHLRNHQYQQPFKVYSPADIMPEIIKKAGLEDRRWEHRLIEKWTELAGAEVARHTRPGKMEGATLVVFVTNSSWLFEMSRHGHRQLLKNIHRILGDEEIKKLRFQIDPDVT